MFQFIIQWYHSRRLNAQSKTIAHADAEEQAVYIAQKVKEYALTATSYDLDSENKDWHVLIQEPAQYYALHFGVKHPNLTRLYLSNNHLLQYQSYLKTNAPFVYRGLYGSLFQALSARKPYDTYIHDNVLRAYNIPVEFWLEECRKANYLRDGIKSRLKQINLDSKNIIQNYNDLLRCPGILIIEHPVDGAILLVMSALLYPELWTPELFHAYEHTYSSYNSNNILTWVNYFIGLVAHKKGYPWSLDLAIDHKNSAYAGLVLKSLIEHGISEDAWEYIDSFLYRFFKDNSEDPTGEDHSILGLSDIVFKEPRYTELAVQYDDYFREHGRNIHFDTMLDTVYRIPQSVHWVRDANLAKSQWTLSDEQLYELCSRPEGLHCFNNPHLKNHLKDELLKAESIGMTLWEVYQIERPVSDNDTYIAPETELYLT